MKITTNLRRQPNLRFTGLSFLVIPLLGLIDYLSGSSVSFSIFYLLPVSTITWYAGNIYFMILASVASSITWLIADLTTGIAYSTQIIPYWNSAVRFGFFLIVGILLLRLKEANELLEIRVQERTADLTKESMERKRAEETVKEYASELEHRVEERTLQLVQANRSKDEFLASMSHELRTPLNSILGFSEFLLEQRRGPLNEKQEQYIQMTSSSGEHLLGLINDLLDVSKIEAGILELHSEIISVNEICESSLNFIQELAGRKSISIEFRNEPSNATLHADPQRLKQILVNLLSNAVKFTPENGAVSLEVRTNLESEQIHFSVIDNGVGISSNDLKRLFRPFTQVDSSLNRQQEGTGLGLSLVSKLTDLHGGSVSVESEVGAGSRFIVNLPWRVDIINQRSASGPHKQLLADQSREKLHEFSKESSSPGIVLLAEDNLSNVLTLADYLESSGYEVVVANDGLEAINLAEKVNPNIILMDIQMPSLDGLEAIRRLRSKPEFASVPIIALTALAMLGDRERCLEAGANEYLSKPVSLKGLAKTIGELLA